MVATRKSTGNLPPPKATKLDQDDDSDDDVEVDRPTKNAKTYKKARGSNAADTDSSFVPNSKTGNRRPRAGKLALMLSMPVDVFCEIACHLGPDDLLRMARASKLLRGLLMSKSSKPIWRAAEEAIGMPACPSDLSSPQYASLVFDKFCMRCDARMASRLELSLRIRLCKKCHNANIARGFVIASSSLSDAERREVLKLSAGAGNIIRPNKEDMKNMTSYSLNVLRYYKPAFEALLQEYHSFALDSDGRKEFVAECHERTYNIWLHVPSLSDWVHNLGAMKAEDNRALKSSHSENVLKRLEELGYTKNDFICTHDERGWKWKALVAQPRKLTDRTWGTLRPQLEETIRLRREKKAVRDKQERTTARKKRLVEYAREFISSEEGKLAEICCVTSSEFIAFPLAKEIIDNDELPVDFPSELWIPTKGKLIELNEFRLGQIEDDLVSKVPNISEKFTDKKTLLRRATTVFTRNHSYGGSDVLTFTETLKKLRERCQSSFDFVEYNTYPFSWSSEAFCASPQLTGIANTLLVALGLPEDSTAIRLESLGFSFLCMCCVSEARQLMTWEGLMGHFFTEYNQFERLRKAKVETECADVIVIADHDVDANPMRPVAVDTRLKLSKSMDIQECPELGKWITKCTCENCALEAITQNIFTHTLKCQQCALLDVSKYFRCPGTLSAHLRLVHGERAN